MWKSSFFDHHLWSVFLISILQYYNLELDVNSELPGVLHWELQQFLLKSRRSIYPPERDSIHRSLRMSRIYWMKNRHISELSHHGWIVFSFVYFPLDAYYNVKLFLYFRYKVTWITPFVYFLSVPLCVEVRSIQLPEQKRLLIYFTWEKLINLLLF